MYRRRLVDASQEELDDSSLIAILILRLLLNSSPHMSDKQDKRHANLLGAKCHKCIHLCWSSSYSEFQGTSDDKEPCYNPFLK
jgi:hypothetical protein